MRRILLIILSLVFMSCPVYAGSQQTSGVTVTTIIDNARTYLNESSTTFLSDAQMLVFLNDGMIDLTGFTLSGQTTETLTLVSDTVEYPITSEYTTVVAVIYIDEDGKEEGLKDGNVWSVGRTEADLMPRADQVPVFWYEWAGSVGAYPSLETVSGTTPETIRLYMVKRPEALTSGTSVITTPAIYDKALTLYIVAQALIRDKKMGASRAVFGLYETELVRLRKDLFSATKETAEPIR